MTDSGLYMAINSRPIDLSLERRRTFWMLLLSSSAIYSQINTCCKATNAKWILLITEAWGLCPSPLNLCRVLVRYTLFFPSFSSRFFSHTLCKRADQRWTWVGNGNVGWVRSGLVEFFFTYHVGLIGFNDTVIGWVQWVDAFIFNKSEMEIVTKITAI